MTPKAIGISCAPLMLAVACSAPPVADLAPATARRIEDVAGSAWARLAESRIYFGHQSVGDDILLGVRELVRDHPKIGLDVEPFSTAASLGPGRLLHEKVGRNFSYRSKLDAFSRRLNEDLSGRLDVALLKFCYVDITPETDVEGMFRDYEAALRELQQRHPSVTFVHVTEPLTWHLSGAPALLRRSKDLVREALGRRGYGRFFDNAPRTRYNELLRARYEGREPLFDLAAVESSYPDGRRLAYAVDGGIHPAMVPAYTDDGGHLNAIGRAHVAEHLLVFLADLMASRATEPPTRGARPAAASTMGSVSSRLAARHRTGAGK